MPGLPRVLGMHAFGLEETGDYARAEAPGRRGVELEPRDGWAQHAVAHVLEMQNRQADGIAWMRANPTAWARDSFFAVHNWWHLALYHLDLGDIDEVLALYDGPIYGGRSGVVLDMIDASALLWRLRCAASMSATAGRRWPTTGRRSPRRATTPSTTLHAMMAFVGAGRRDAAAGGARRAGTRRWRATATTPPSRARSASAVDAGDPGLRRRRLSRDASRLLRPIRRVAHRFGGSHAQRDLLDLTLIEAAFRAGQTNLAAALAAERHEGRHESPLAQLFLRRAAALSTAA